MKSKYIHLSKFGYFYTYCFQSTNNGKIKREISKLKELIDLTNNLDAKDNFIYNKKLARKEKRIEKILKKIAEKEPMFLLNFIDEYSNEYINTTKETDPKIVARHIAQSFFDAYYIRQYRKNNIVMLKNNYQEKENDIVINLTDHEKKALELKDNYEAQFERFLLELKKCKYSKINRQLNIIDKVVQLKVKKGETKEDYKKRVDKVIRYVSHHIDIIFIKGKNYPFRKQFIKVLSKIIYVYNIKLTKLSDLKKHLKQELKKELLDKYDNNQIEIKKENNYGYEIPNNTSAEMIIEVNEELEKEKYKLIEKSKKGEKIKFDRPFASNIQSKKIDIINSYFDKRFDFNLTLQDEDEDFSKKVIELCELSDEITDDLFKKVLFDAHDSYNLTIIQAYEKNEALRTLYSLYSPIEKLDKYEKTRIKFEKVFNLLPATKQNTIKELIKKEKQKKHILTIVLVPTEEIILNNLVIREMKFIESHAVEEFKHKALYNGKYLNYDLEVVARDIPVDELPNLYQKIKRTITYTNFVDEIKPGEDREKKYKEARIIQRKTIAVAQEMIAKTIINKNCDHEFDITYDSYQNMLNQIYKEILHEERILHFYDECYDENEILENNYREKKKVWDEHSMFVKALYSIISKKVDK